MTTQTKIAILEAQYNAMTSNAKLKDKVALISKIRALKELVA